MVCDNQDGLVEVGCRYLKTVGTTFSETISESMSISEDVSYEMEMGFFEFFSETIGMSITTGYDWSHSSTMVKTEEETFEA